MLGSLGDVHHRGSEGSVNLSTIQAANQSYNEFQSILEDGKGTPAQAYKILRTFETFRKLEVDPTHTEEKAALLKKVNDLSYRFLKKNGYFSCCGCLNLLFGPSYSKQLENRIRHELEVYEKQKFMNAFHHSDFL